MCRKLLCLMTFVLVLGLVSNASALILEIQEIQDTTTDGNSLLVQDAHLRGLETVDPYRDHRDDNYGRTGDDNRITNYKGGQRGALMWFDLSSIPSGATVNSATLKLRLRD